MLESLDEPIGLPLVIFMDPPEHDWMRTLVSRAFTPRRVGALEVYVAELVDRYLDPLVGTPGFDYVEQFGALLPGQGLCLFSGRNIEANSRKPLRFSLFI